MLHQIGKKKVMIIVEIITIAISIGAALFAYNVERQYIDGLKSEAETYSVIIGAEGSDSELIMNALYLSDTPTETIPYALIHELKSDSRVAEIIPFAMGSTYNGFNIAGTSSEYLAGKELAKGNMFSNDSSLEVVVGYNVAKKCSLSIGDTIHTLCADTEEKDQTFTVIGILECSKTPHDNIVFTALPNIWNSKNSEASKDSDINGYCNAFLIKTNDAKTATSIINEYDKVVWTDDDGHTALLQAIVPATTIETMTKSTKGIYYVIASFCTVAFCFRPSFSSQNMFLKMIGADMTDEIIRKSIPHQSFWHSFYPELLFLSRANM